MAERRRIWLLVDVEAAVDVEQDSTQEIFFLILNAGFFFRVFIGSIFDLPIGWRLSIVGDDGMTLVSRFLVSSSESTSLLDNNN